jgi:type IV pilus assembly protein PilO
MRSDFTFRRQAILAGVAFLVLADGALAIYSWQLASAPQTPRQQFSLEMRQHDLLKADIKRAQDIRDKIPAIQKDCDQFEQSLFPASAGYSSVTSELGSIAKKNGIQLEDLSFRQTEIASRGTTEVAIDATVSGDYKRIIQFLNGVQRSANLYEVDTLTLAPENTNQGSSEVLKVSLHLKTYFRTAG